MASVRSNPRAYLVPLCEDGKPVRAHLLALARYGSEKRVLEEARELVETFRAPWRTPTRLRVNRRGEIALPRGVFLGAALGRRRWFRPTVLQELVQRHRSAVEWGTGFAVCLSKPAGPTTFWRLGRSVLVIDLDLQRLTHARTLLFSCLPLAIRPYAAYEAAILDGRGHEWDVTAGTFRTPAESRARFRAERESARDGFFSHGRRLIHPKRWLWLRAELEDRAALHGTSLEQELQEEVRRGFDSLETEERIREFLGTCWSRAVAKPNNPIAAVRRTVSRDWPALLGALRRALGGYLQDAILPGRRRGYESRREDTEAGMSPEKARRYRDSADPDADREFLERIIAEETEQRLRSALTPAEDELFQAKVAGETLAAYAKRTGRRPGTVYAQAFSVRRKAEPLGNAT